VTKGKASPTRGLVLTPGASATRDHSALVAIDSLATAAGVSVARIDLPRTSKVERHVAAITDAADMLAADGNVARARIALGGRSMGGRMCSMAVADGALALGLALVSYPLHPPGRPQQMRADHFAALRVPCLFVSGTRDAFATPDELETATKAIPGAVTHVWLDGGDHGLRGRDDDVAAVVRDWLMALPLTRPRG
jgi:uncharacterized protein